MAIGRLGGTRSMIRGRVGNDIYSIGKDAAGDFMQIVRSRPEFYSDPKTDAQIIARMSMAQIYAALRSFSVITNHSFEGVPYGQPSITKFIELNYPLLREDVIEFWEEGYKFGWQLKGRETIDCGPWIVSMGSLSVPACLEWVMPHRYNSPIFMTISCGVSHPTFGDLRAALGAAAGDYITLVGVAFKPQSLIGRLYMLRHFLSAQMSDDTLLTSENISDAFTYEGNVNSGLTINVSSGVIASTLLPPDAAVSEYGFGAGALILSKQLGGVWRRSNCQLEYDEDMRWGVAPNECFVSWRYSAD